MGDLEATIKGIGVSGTLVYVAMLLYITWRTCFLLFLQPPPATASRQQQLTLPAKKSFHVALFFSALLDLSYYAKLCTGAITSTSFSLHLMALWAELTAFSCVVVVWSRVLNAAKEKDSVLTYVIALDGFVLVWTLVVICLVIVAKDNVDQWVSPSSQPYIFFYLVQALALLSCCLALLYHGIRLQYIVRNHPRWEPLRRERRMRIVLRINAVLSVCTFCFLLRVVLLMAHFIQAEAHQQARFLDPAALVNWYVWCNWVPMCIPASILLFMMKNNPGRERGNIGGATDGGGGLTLGLAAQAGGGQAGGGAETVGILREWEERLVSLNSSGNTSINRNYWRPNSASLYSPPSPSEVDAVGPISPAAATPLTPATAISCGRSKPAAVLNLGMEHNGSKEQGSGSTEDEPLILEAV
ncbi:Hypothetical protein NocV09_03100340 [Nannochloropsis oceanica]